MGVKIGPFEIRAKYEGAKQSIGKIGPFLRGKQTIEMVFTVQRNAPNANGDTFDIPYELVNDQGEIVGHGRFEGCHVTHVNHGEIDDSVMKVEFVSEPVDGVLPFKVE